MTVGYTTAIGKSVADRVRVLRVSTQLFGAAVAFNAILLFSVQPLIAKALLPSLGGAPGVWNACMLYFQLMLLAGYAYSAVLVRYSLRTQVTVHISLLLVALAMMPLAIRLPVTVPSETPIAWLITALTFSVGLPFVVLAAGAPLLQHWYSHVHPTDARDPYVLYALSNAGSLGALLGYPFLIEPLFDIASQSHWWNGLFWITTLLVTLCAVVLRDKFRPTHSVLTIQSLAESNAPVKSRLRDWINWLLLSCCGSLLLLAVTTLLTQDVAAVPLLWIVPLCLYLISFIVAFSSAGRKLLSLAVKCQTVAVLVVLGVSLVPGLPLFIVACAYLLGFLVFCIVCHTTLAALKPAPQYLSSFYICLAAGGALGGTISVFVVPRVFSQPTEYFWAVALAVALQVLRVQKRGTVRERVLDFAWPLVFAFVLAFAPQSLFARQAGLWRFVALAACGAVLIDMSRRPLRFAVGIAAWLSVARARAGEGAPALLEHRDFFGTLTVRQQGSYRVVNHGTTLHGAQSTSPELRQVPMTYYHRAGPFGALFDKTIRYDDKPLNVGVVGLGIGAIACYGRSVDQWTFFEIAPAVVRMARDTTLFTYLRDCSSSARVVIGDGRLSLEQRSEVPFDLLVVDAFLSDAIPVHLLTREGFAILMRNVAVDGTLVMHISNRYIDLGPVVHAAAREAGFPVLESYGRVQQRIAPNEWFMSSEWLAIPKDPKVRNRILRLSGWRVLSEKDLRRPWTDSWSDIVSAFRRSR